MAFIPRVWLDTEGYLSPRLSTRLSTDDLPTADKH